MVGCIVITLKREEGKTNNSDNNDNNNTLMS
jgi:hypothetical protein